MLISPIIGFILGVAIAYLLGVRNKIGLLIAGILGAVFAPILIVLITLVTIIVLILIILLIILFLAIIFKVIALHVLV